MKQLLALTLLFLYTFGFSQLQSVILDAETKERIPYVNIWVENENVGTTSDEDGSFELKIDSFKIIVFSAIGYETRRVSSDSIMSTMMLKPAITELGEVVVRPEKRILNQDEKLLVGTFEKTINSLFYSATVPWIRARYFEYKEEYGKIRYVDKIKLLTSSQVRGAVFNVRLYSKNEKGEPGEYLYNKNIIGKAKKALEVTEVDLSELDIEFPKNGFFVAIEYLIIENNKYKTPRRDGDPKRIVKRVNYAPSVGSVPAKSNDNAWIFFKGKWYKVSKIQGAGRFVDKYALLAVELTLSK